MAKDMTMEEFAERWCLKVVECMKGDDYIMHDKDSCLSDLRSVIRGKLVEYDKWLCGNSERLLNIPTSEKAVDEFLKDNQ